MKYYIRYGMNSPGEWEEIEADTEEEAENEALRLAQEEADMSMYFEATAKKPEGFDDQR